MFQETLAGEALSWFYELPSNSVDCFRELADKFVNRFILQTDGQNTVQLFKVKQDRGEGLKDFVNRWQDATARVRNFDKKVAEEAFIQGLLPRKFMYAVKIECPQGYDELIEMAVRHAQADHDTYGGISAGKMKVGEQGGSPVQVVQEIRAWTGEQEPNSYPVGKRHKERSWGKAGKQHNAQGKAKCPYQDVGYARAVPAGKEHFSALNATYEAIWNENRSAIPPPPARKFPPPRLTKEDTGKFCAYHGEASHNINSCIELKKAVERWLTEGKLQQYVPGPRQVGAIEVYWTINTIHGGSRIDNRSNKAKKQCTGSRDGREVFTFESRDNQQVTTGWKSVTFLEEEEEGIRPHEDPFLITLQLDHYITKKIMVDMGASVNVLFRNAWKCLHRGSNKLIQDHESLISFSGDVVQPLGSDSFGVSMEGQEGVARVTVEFIVVDCESSYNGILGRPALWKLKSFVAGHMLMMKVPTPTGVITIQGDQGAARYCYAIDNGRKRSEVLLARQATASSSDPYMDFKDDTDSDEERPGSAEETERVSVSDEFPDRQVTIGTRQASGVRATLISFLKENSGAFAWTYKDMPGISSGIVTHQLGIKKRSPPVRQKQRTFKPKKYEAMKEEVQKLIDIKFIREVRYPQWLANVVMVPKKSTWQWRMCVDYSNLNRACPKDSFPLPRIDQLVDSTSGFELLSFMDAYVGYNQIRMDPRDEEHTAFTTDMGLYCYRVMPFGLKIAGATYQRLMNVMFTEYLEKIMEVYVDDMLVKSLKAEEHVGHLQKVFKVIMRFGMRLNPHKCVFGVVKGKFMGHIISRRGIEANPEKIQAILDMEQPKERNEVSSLAGKIVTLARFVSRLTDKCTPFFRLLKDQRCKEIVWGPEQEEAFKQIKAYLTSAPVLSKPISGEMLYLYVVASQSAVSSVLIRKESDIEHAVFYAGKGFTPAESWYPDVEKLALTLIITARRLRHYFQAHSITLYTNHPLRQIMQKPEISGRLVKWEIELGEFDIHYRPRVAIIGQAAADLFLSSCP